MKEYTATALVPVQFHGQTLVTTQHNGEPHVAMRPIVEAMGLDWQAQLQRIKRKELSYYRAGVANLRSNGH
jgi:prophage antirepressor-like protein